MEVGQGDFICTVDCALGWGARGQLLWELMTTSLDCFLDAYSKSCLGACDPKGPRFVPGQFCPMRHLLSTWFFPLPTYLARAGAHFQPYLLIISRKLWLLSSPRQDMLHKLNLCR